MSAGTLKDDEFEKGLRNRLQFLLDAARHNAQLLEAELLESLKRTFVPGRVCWCTIKGAVYRAEVAYTPLGPVRDEGGIDCFITDQGRTVEMNVHWKTLSIIEPVKKAPT